MKSPQKKLISFSLAMSLLVLVAGCGKNDDNGNAPPPTGTGTGVVIPPGGTPVNWCSYPSITSSGGLRCVFSLMPVPPLSSLLTCTPGIPCPPSGFFQVYGVNTTFDFPKLSSNKFSVATTVQANDTVIFQGDGSYGQADGTSSCGDDDLEEIDLAGFHNSTPKFAGNGQLAGLLARVQKTGSTLPDYYNLGDMNIQIVTDPGLMTWGLNSPYSNNCHYLRVDRLEVQRCRDSSGNSVICPQPY